MKTRANAKSVGKRVANCLAVSGVFLAASFLGAGLGGCVWHLVDYGGRPPEYVGWLVFFLFAGGAGALFSLWGPLVLAPFVWRYNGPLRPLLLVAAALGAVSGPAALFIGVWVVGF